MSEQLDFLDSRYTPPPHRGEPSQIEGAKKIAPHTSRLQQLVLNAIDALGGASIEQICDRTGLKVQTVCGRIGELKKLGHIREASFTVKADSGVSVKVWIQTSTAERR